MGGEGGGGLEANLLAAIQVGGGRGGEGWRGGGLEATLSVPWSGEWGSGEGTLEWGGYLGVGRGGGAPTLVPYRFKALPLNPGAPAPEPWSPCP